MTETSAITAARKLWQVRVWFLATWVLAYPLRLLVRYAHRRMNADPKRFAERLGRPSQSAKGSVIWIHAASLGEAAQIAPLAQQLFEPDGKLLVTSSTQAGAEWVARELPDAIHQFAPMDTGGAVRGFLDAWDIRAAIFFEGDFAPRLTLAAQARGIPMALLNARHSRTRERFPKVFGALLSGFAIITCRSEAVADGIRALGVQRARIKVLPDLRIAAPKLPCPDDVLNEVKVQVGTRPVWLAASTHAADEAAVLSAHKQVRETLPDCLLIVAPRHPKRGAPLEAAAKAQGFNVIRRTSGTPIAADADIYIADTLGELGVFLTLARVTFLGGSFGTEGGHNPYEPARFGAAILSGPRVKNFEDAFATLQSVAAAEIVASEEALGPRVADLMQSDASHSMGAAGQHYMVASDASLPETVASLKSALDL